jgi:PAS domain S-box-containing protein
MSTKSSVLSRHLPSPDLQSEKIFRQMVESVQDYGIFMLDPEGYIATWNIGAERMKLYTPKEIIGQHFSVFYPPDDIASRKPWRELEAASADGRFEDEGWRLRKNGTRFWANVVITRVNDENGKLLGFGKITRDITDRRQAELRYRLLVEGVTDYAIYSLDPNGNITSWNSGVERIKGYKAEEILGKHFSMFYTPEDRVAGLPNTVLRTAEQEGHFEGEGWRMRKNGERFWCSIVVTPVHDEEGTLTGFSKVTRDITERKFLMEQLQNHAEQLELRVAESERTNAELEAFSYSVSHDLRAPLRTIEGFATALREDYGAQLDQTATEYLGEIAAASVRMNRLVQDLLNYSRISRIEMSLQPTRISDAIRKVVGEVGRNAGKIDVALDDATSVLAHPATLGQVIYNLVSNAVKFAREDVACEVRITTSRLPDGFLRTAVRDNGIGIAPEHQERIFKVFERLHGQEEYPGTGIGLAIVKRGVERMGGRMGVDSKPGEGSEFWFDLMITDPNVEQEQESK